MPLVTNEKTGETGWFDPQTQTLKRIITNEKTGGKALWDDQTQSLKPLSPDFIKEIDFATQGAKRLEVPQGGGRVEPMKVSERFTGGDPIIRAINAVPEAAGNAAGDFIAEKVRDVTGPGMIPATAGALTSGAVQYLSPGILARGLQGATKLAVKALPGSQAARMEGAIENTRGLLDAKKLKSESVVSGKEAALQPLLQDKIPLQNTSGKIDQLIKTLEIHPTVTPDDPALTYLRRLKKQINDFGQAPSAEWVQTEMSRIGTNTRVVATQGEDVRKGFAELYGTMLEDLKNQAPTTVRTPPKPQSGWLGNQYQAPPPSSGTATIQPTQAGPMIRERQIASRQAAGLEDVNKMFEDMVMTKRGLSGAEDVNANRMVDKLRKNDFVRESLQPDDLKDLEAIFRKIGDLPMMPPPKGAMFGAGRFAGTAGVASMALGPQAGIAIAGLADASRYLLPTRWGRKAVRAVLESGPISVDKVNKLNQLARLAQGEIMPSDQGR